MSNSKSSNKKLSIIILLTIILSLFLSFALTGCNSDNEANNLEHEVITEMLQDYDKAYVVGHRNPDTDTVCSAILCSRLYQQAYNFNAIPVVSGKLNNETKYVLNKFGVEEPELMKEADENNFILVDHTNVKQSMKEMDEDATVFAIYDHHPLGDIESDPPMINITLPIGSTASIMYLQYLKENLPITQQDAGMIISCILSDTSNLTNSSTTEVDKKIIDKLKPIAKIDDIDQYYDEMLQQLVNYEGMTANEIFMSGLKDYSMEDWTYAISSVSAYGEENTNKLREQMKQYVEEYGPSSDCKHIYVMINDVKNNKTDIFGYGENSSYILKKLFGSETPQFDTLISRKADLLPKLKEHYGQEE